MARARKASGGGARRGGGSARATKTTSRKKPAAPAQDVEVVEEAGGMSLDDGVILGTFLALLIAFVLIDKARGAYGEGMFFTGDQPDGLESLELTGDRAPE